MGSEMCIRDRASTIETMNKASKDGKLVIFKAWPGFTWWSDKELIKKPHADQLAVAKKNLTFPLACFLVGAGPNCYFCYTWGWLPEYGTFDRYPEFDKQLGPPKADAVRTGWTFRREFQHASVFVDIEKRIGRIDWKPSAKKSATVKKESLDAGNSKAEQGGAGQPATRSESK